MPKLPSAGYQRIEPTAKAGTVVQVMDLDAPSVASKEELENPQYTGSSGMVDTRDATIRELVAQALHDAGSDKAERAEAMRAFVHRWISIKNYRTAFASASETARNRTGDCSEHGVLLAAMLRIDGIPSRLATGLVYFQPEGDKGEGVYGWHMWTQAIIDDTGSISMPRCRCLSPSATSWPTPRASPTRRASVTSTTSWPSWATWRSM